ncbi:MAG: FtsX-like permease family protein, partial [Paraclostridium sp.]
MKNFLKLSMKYINKYISRSMAICLSMILSIALIVGVGSLSESARQANIDKTKYEEGLYHVRYKDLNKEQLNIVIKNKDIQEVGMTSYYDSNKPDGKLMINLTRANEEYIKSCNSYIKTGKLPTKPDEIALETWVLKNMGIEPRVGEKVTIDLYNKGIEETYTLVGVLKDRTREKAAGMMEGFLVFDYDNVQNIDAYITFDEKSDIKNNIKNIAKEANINSDNIRKNNMLLEALGATEEINYSLVVLAIIAALVSGIVIYGIFNISILQRTSEYGVIRAIGGNSIQILKLLMLELVALLSISIPIGILIGVFGAKIFSSKAGGLFTEGVVEITNLTVKVDMIGFAIMVALVTVVVISLITLRNIKKITPINAIKMNISSKNISKRNIISISRLIKIMSFESAISFKNIFRNKKSFYMIILSMSLGSAIFISASFYAHLADIQGDKVAETSDINSDYKISIIPTRPMDYGVSSDSIDEIKELEGVSSINSIQLLYSRMFLKESEILEPKYFEQQNSYPYNKNVLNGLLTKDKDNEQYILKNIIYGYDDNLLKELDKYLLDGSMDINKMKSENIALVKIPHPIGPNVVDIKVGDTVKVTFREDGNSSPEYLRMEDKGGKYIETEFIVGGIVDEVIDTADYYTGNNSVDIIISSSRFKEITGFKNYQIINIDKKQSKDHNELNDEILNITNRIEGSVLYDFTQEREDLQLLQENKMIFIYSIIAILFTISLFNIMNNISYSLISRTNEFGMIRAIGITNKEFKNMVRF